MSVHKKLCIPYTWPQTDIYCAGTLRHPLQAIMFCHVWQFVSIFEGANQSFVAKRKHAASLTPQ